MKVKVEMELEFVDNLIDWNSEEEKKWLFEEILPQSTVGIFSQEIGDYITNLKKVEEITYFSLDDVAYKLRCSVQTVRNKITEYDIKKG